MITTMMGKYNCNYYFAARAPSIRAMSERKGFFSMDLFPKNLSLERKIATNLHSLQKYVFRTNIEFSRKCIYLQLKPI